ncbi:MAG: TcaA 3rd/4th domain-containing protein [Clostridium sp.]|uniref:TcaA 3rd/4th domain-containing protein n=1 Tax=Clostridium sp. TaxID=1506 RepID=UPI003F2CC414
MAIKDNLYIIKEFFIKKCKKIKGINKDNYKYFFKKNIKWIIAIVLLIFLMAGYSIGNATTTKNQIIKELNLALKDGKANKLTNIIEVNNKKVSKKELLPLIEYYKGKNELVNSTVEQLSDNNKTDIFELVNEKSFFGDNYHINLKTFNVTLTSNFKDAQISLNNSDEKYGTTDTIRNIIPGNYVITGEIKSDYGDIKSEKDITVMKDEKIDMNLKGVMVTVQSDIKDAKVMIDGKDSGIIAKNFKDIGPIPSDGSVNISLQKEFPWGVVDGKEVMVKDSKNIKLSMDLVNDELWNNVLGSVNTFYGSVMDALNNEDENLIKGASDAAKKKVYSILEKNYFIFKNKYEMTSLNIDKEKSHFEYNGGKYKGTVVCDVNYDVSMALFGLGKKENNKKFFTKVVYKNNEWIVDDVENFSL